MQNDESIPNLTSNSNRITFDPVFVLKTVENWQNIRISLFSTVFFGKKRVKRNSIWILRTDLESSHHFASLKILFDRIFTFSCLDLPCYVLNTNVGGVSFFSIMKISMSSSWYALKNASDRGGETVLFKKVVHTNRITLMPRNVVEKTLVISNWFLHS